MRCEEEGCNGVVSVGPDTAIFLRIGCRNAAEVYPCQKCGRLHWPEGEAVSSRRGDRAFINLETKEIFHKPTSQTNA